MYKKSFIRLFAYRLSFIVYSFIVLYYYTTISNCYLCYFIICLVASRRLHYMPLFILCTIFTFVRGTGANKGVRSKNKFRILKKYFSDF